MRLRRRSTRAAARSPASPARSPQRAWAASHRTGVAAPSLAASLRGASEEEQDAAARDDESARAVRALRQAASDVLQRKELEASIGRRVDRLIEAGYG